MGLSNQANSCQSLELQVRTQSELIQLLTLYLGAGKTTLLNYLSDKDPSKNLNKQGDIFINGVSRSKVDYGRYVAYVQQEDVLYQTLTVRE